VWTNQLLFSSPSVFRTISLSPAFTSAESNPKLQGGWCNPTTSPAGIWSPPRAGRLCEKRRGRRRGARGRACIGGATTPQPFVLYSTVLSWLNTFAPGRLHGKSAVMREVEDMCYERWQLCGIDSGESSSSTYATPLGSIAFVRVQGVRGHCGRDEDDDDVFICSCRNKNQPKAKYPKDTSHHTRLFRGPALMI